MTTILLDVDGCIADFIGGVCRVLQAHGFTRTPAEFTAWNMETTLLPQELAIVYAAMERPGFAARLDWYPGAPAFVSTLKDLGKVRVLTAPHTRSATWYNDRAEWLSPVIPKPHVMTCGLEDKPMVRGDIMIEDNIDVALAWLQANPGIVVLFDRPWNQRPKVRSRRLNRVHNYGEAARVVLSEVQA